MAVILETICA